MPYFDQPLDQMYFQLANLYLPSSIDVPHKRGDEPVGRGHKDDYYKKHRAGRFSENFANLFNALTRGENSLDWKLAQRFAPNSARELRLKLREIDDD